MRRSQYQTSRHVLNEEVELLGQLHVEVVVDLEEFKDMELRGEALDYAWSILTDRITKMVRVLGSTECEIEPLPLALKVKFNTHKSIKEKDITETFTRYYIPIKKVTIKEI